MTKFLIYGAALGVAVALFPVHIFRTYAETPDQAKASVSASDAAFKKKDAVIVELFTSQGCSSCPPAEAYMRELAGNPHVLTLEYHVDYWDSPNNGWKDAFSSREWTERQVAYNHTLLKSDQIYTPQMIIDGRYQGIGSQKKSIEGFMREAKVQRGSPIQIAPHVIDGKKLLISVSGRAEDQALSVVLVRFLRREETKIAAGENRGKAMANYNIVTDVNEIGQWGGGKMLYKVSIAPLSPAENCAVFLQDPESMRIFAGRFCGL